MLGGGVHVTNGLTLDYPVLDDDTIYSIPLKVIVPCGIIACWTCNSKLAGTLKWFQQNDIKIYEIVVWHKRTALGKTQSTLGHLTSC